MSTSLRRRSRARASLTARPVVNARQPLACSTNFRIHASPAWPSAIGVGRAVEDDDARARVGQDLRGPGDVVGQLAQRPEPLARHAQPGRVHADPRGSVALELYLGRGVAGGDDETDARGRRGHLGPPRPGRLSATTPYRTMLSTGRCGWAAAKGLYVIRD